MLAKVCLFSALTCLAAASTTPFSQSQAEHAARMPSPGPMPTMQSRSGFGQSTVSSDYARGLFNTFTFILGLISATNLAFAKADLPSILSGRSFDVNAGFGAGDAFGVQGGFQVGNPLQNDLLFPVIIGLGLLSLFNIVLTFITPLLSKGDDKSDDAGATARSMNSADVIHLANTVYEAVQKLNEQYGN